MAKKMLPPTQTDVNEAALDGVHLVQQLGLQLDDETANRVAGRKVVVLTSISLFSVLFLYAEPIVDGWKV